MSWANSGFITKGGKIDCRGCFSIESLMENLIDSLFYARKYQRLYYNVNDPNDTMPSDQHWCAYSYERLYKREIIYYDISASENKLLKFCKDFSCEACTVGLKKTLIFYPRGYRSLTGIRRYDPYGGYIGGVSLYPIIQRIAGVIDKFMRSVIFINQAKYSEGHTETVNDIGSYYIADLWEDAEWDWDKLCEHVGIVDVEIFYKPPMRPYAWYLNKLYCMINTLVYVLEVRFKPASDDKKTDYYTIYTVKRLNIDPRWLDEGLATLATNPKNIN